MTIKQLRSSQRAFLREFDRAVIRRRKNIKRVMANRLKARLASRNPNNSSTKKAVALKHKLYNTIYRSVMNKASNSRCARYHMDKKSALWKGGWWLGPSRKMARRCRA